MGLMGIQEIENREMGLSGVPQGTKNKYKRMDSELTEDEDDLNRRHQQERSRSTKRYVFACAIFASFNFVLLGYDVGVMSGAILFIQEDLNITEIQQEVLIGCLSVVSLVGSLAGGKTSDAIGRKWTMGLAAVFFQLGALVMTFAPSFPVLMVGRLMAGVGIGLAIMITPVYIAEISPSVARGSLTSLPEISVSLGILLGYISNYAFSGLSVHINWRIMLAIGILPSVLLGIALCVIPESPRWLVLQRRVDEAREVLLRTIDDKDEVEERLAEIQLAARAGDAEKAVWREFLRPSPALRRMLIIGIGVPCFQQITGIDSTVYYSPTIFKEAGVVGESKLLAATVAVGVSKTMFILVPIFLVDKIGRKPLLYVSTIGMTMCLFSIGITISFFKEGPFGIGMAILSVCGSVGFFSLGMGPICWVVTSEIFPLKLRAQAAALGVVGNRVCSSLISMSFLSLARGITVAGCFFIFSGISALSVVFIYSFLPETKGKSLEEIELLFQDGHERGGHGVEHEDVELLV